MYPVVGTAQEAGGGSQETGQNGRNVSGVELGGVEGVRGKACMDEWMDGWLDGWRDAQWRDEGSGIPLPTNIPTLVNNKVEKIRRMGMG